MDISASSSIINADCIFTMLDEAASYDAAMASGTIKNRRLGLMREC